MNKKIFLIRQPTPRTKKGAMVFQANFKSKIFEGFKENVEHSNSKLYYYYFFMNFC